MKVLAAHRQRVAEARTALERLFTLHKKLFDLRSRSWAEQSQGDLDRAEVLAAIREEINAVEDEIELTRVMLRLESPPALREPGKESPGR